MMCGHQTAYPYCLCFSLRGSGDTTRRQLKYNIGIE
jgi:hypothetical protein